MLEHLQGKKIAILGLGANNKRLAEFFEKQGLKPEVVEWKDPSELTNRLSSFDLVFRTPGLPYLSEPIQLAQAKGVEISSQTRLFFQICPCPIVGVTGTKGKGTTSSLIAKILSAGNPDASVGTGKKVWLGGNIGTDPFEFIDQIKPDDLVVLELSSFQLQDLEVSPHIAVVLSVTPDHLNHHKDFDEYIKAKSNLVAYQNTGDVAVLHPTLPQWFKDLGKGKKIVIDPNNAVQYETKLHGKHNLDNISAAVSAAKILGISEENIKKAVAGFDPLPHRLSILKTINGITYVDDGFSTNIEPTIAAIETIDSKIILIIGGSDKGLDFFRLGQAIKNSGKIKGVVVIGEVTDKILQSLDGFDGEILTGAGTMQEMLDQAKKIARRGDTILFSPATASFGLFKNEYDRGEQFVKLVNSL